MTTFEDRGTAFEAKFAHDAEMQFKAVARRDRALGFWAAGLLGKTGDDAVQYMREVVKADVDDARHEAALRKVKADLGDLTEESTIRAKMAEFMDAAKAELLNEV